MKRTKFRYLPSLGITGGGAFIKDANNAYSENILVQKDGYVSIDEANYFNIEIQVRKAADELSLLFVDLAERKLKNGVIKIDVEGYELTVLRGIAESLPKIINVYIIFENWDPKIKILDIVKFFNGRATVGILDRPVPKNGWLKFIDLLSAPFKAKRLTTIKIIEDYESNYVGDIVLKIS